MPLLVHFWRTPAEVADETREVSYNVETSGTQVQIICRQLAKKLAPEEIGGNHLSNTTCLMLLF